MLYVIKVPLKYYKLYAHTEISQPKHVNLWPHYADAFFFVSRHI